MPDAINRRCPQCGRKAHDRLLVQCPDCRVPFVLDEAAAPATLTTEQISLLAAQVLRSWKFWAVLLVLIAGGAWAVVAVADRVIDARTKAYMAVLDQQASNRIGNATSQLSNQIALEFKQPRIRATIDQVARDRAAEIISNGVRPTLDAFADAMDLAASQLAHSTNLIAQLERDARAAQRRIPPPESNTTVVQPQATNPVPAVASSVSNLAPASTTKPNPASDASSVKLTLANRTILPAGSGYLVTLFFKPANNSAAGPVEMVAGTFRQTAKILNFAELGANPAEPVLNDTGDAAKLRFNVSPNDNPTIVLELSAPTIVRVSSDALDQDLTIPVAADKMQLSPADK